MQFSSAKSVHARKLTCLTAFAMFVALTGCANTDDAAPELEDATDASVSGPMEYIPASEEGPAQNVPEPRLSALATEPSQDGALESLEYFWESAQYTRLTGDPIPFELVSSQSCDFCNSFAADWRGAYESGKWAVSDRDVEYEVANIWTTNEIDGTPSVDILFTLSEPETSLYDGTGEIDQGKAETNEDSDWFALLFYDSTAQRWEVEWIGLEELVTWED